MSSKKKSTFAERFARQLNDLRLKVDSLPEEQQPRFREALAGAAKQQHRMEGQCSRIRDMVADVGLHLAQAKHHVDACRREAGRNSPRGRSGVYVSSEDQQR